MENKEEFWCEENREKFFLEEGMRGKNTNTVREIKLKTIVGEEFLSGD